MQYLEKISIGYKPLLEIEVNLYNNFVFTLISTLLVHKVLGNDLLILF